MIFSIEKVSSGMKGILMFMRSKGIKMVLIIVCFSFFCLACAEATIPEKDLIELLPGDELKTWKAEASPQQYLGDDLYLYINGGAEIYHEYGFKKVIVQDYSNQQGKSISIELFEMSVPESAFGMFSFKSSSQGKELSMGNGANLEDYYLNFWDGKYLITLTGFDEDEDTVLGLKQIASSIDAKIKSRTFPPELVKMLPEEKLNKLGVKYFKGPLGLINSYRFFTEGNFPLKEGIRGNYAAGHSLFIFKYDNNNEGLTRFGEVKEKFIKDSGNRELREVDDLNFSLKNEAGDLIYLRSVDQFIFIVLGAGSVNKAEDIIEEIWKKSP